MSCQVLETEIFTAGAVPAAAAAALAAFLAAPLVRRLAVRINAMDVPRDGRRMHGHPIPRIGGLAIILGFFTGAIFFGSGAGQLKDLLPGAVLVAALGLADDLRSIGPWPKLAIQTCAALLAVRGGNVITESSGIFSAGPCLRLGPLGPPVTVLWIVGVTNAFNLIDGLDGLACGISAISSASAALLAGEPSAAVLAASLAGACIGFLPYNLPPARIFMGDTGAMFLGYILAVTAVQGLFRYPARTPFAVPCLILGVPIFDTCFAVVRRAARGRSPLRSDRGHIHHRLVDRGLSPGRTAAFLWAVSALLSLLAAALVCAGGRNR